MANSVKSGLAAGALLAVLCAAPAARAADAGGNPCVFAAERSGGSTSQGYGNPAFTTHSASHSLNGNEPCAPGYRNLSLDRARQLLKHDGYGEVEKLTPVRGWSAETKKDGRKVKVFLSDEGRIATFAEK